MRVSVIVVQNLPWTLWRDRVLALEEQGYDAVYVWDHLVHRTQRLDDPMLDGFGLLAAVAPLTSRIGLGSMVASPTMRHPLLLAKHAVLVDQVSGGRMTLGLGAAGVAMDYAALGVEPWSKREQVDRLRETVECVDAVMRGATSYGGEHWSGDGFSVAPGPVQQPRVPFTIAAHGPRTRRIAAEHALTWNVLTPRDLLAEEAATALAGLQQQMDGACIAVGRDPGDLRRSVMVGSADWPALESVASFEAAAQVYAGLGFDELVLTHPDHPAEGGLGHGTAPPDVLQQIAGSGVLAQVRDRARTAGRD